jgi:acetoacetyl-CoA synthetase
MSNQTPLWTPKESDVKHSPIHLFQKSVALRTGRSFASYRDFHAWSLKESSEFWLILSEFLGIKWMTPPVSQGKWPAKGMLGAKWFPGSHLNFAANLLPPPLDQEVIVSHCEGTVRSSLTGLELHNAVARCMNSLRKSGVTKGDHVFGSLINGPQAIIAMLATASIGAVWSSCSPDFGSSGVHDRVSQVKPKVIFATRDYVYNTKKIRSIDYLSDAMDKLSFSPEVIVCDHLDPQHDQFWNYCGKKDRLSVGLDPIQFEPMEFDAPLYILFSSGTTGLPKCIVHGVGGTLIQHKKELMLHSNLVKNDSLFFFTTCGWMMWNWMVSALSCESKIYTFDGSPSSPSMSTLWDIVQRERITHFGTSPKYIAACIANDFLPNKIGSYRDLKCVLSTGSPLMPEHYQWIYRQFSDVHLASISGGTDIISCFMLGNPTLPVYAGEIQCPGLGMAVESWNDAGQPVRQEKGELVCTAPFVSMPVGFLNDPGHKKYTETYFRKYKHKEVWTHGDFVESTERGSFIVYGRSDATLNPGGVRIGTSEIYRVVETCDFALDAIAVGKKYRGDIQIILFVKLKDQVIWTTEMDAALKKLISKELTPRHVPARIYPVQEIPYTRSGKKTELAVTQAIHDQPIPNLNALANPQALDEFRQLGKGMPE